ncbi:hypothetical protein F4604DRAFT_1673049 [Suillus subluteus]|nr:hypothetical protein F4604DRAFT_1673049 [Suillus subluteus]
MNRSAAQFALLFIAQLEVRFESHSDDVGPTERRNFLKLLLRRHLKAVGILGFTILVWDHVITFADEVEIIRGRPKKLLTSTFGDVLILAESVPHTHWFHREPCCLPSWSFIVRAFRSVRGGYGGNWTSSCGTNDVPASSPCTIPESYPPAFELCIVNNSWRLAVVSWRGEWNTESEIRGGLVSARVWVPLCYDTVVFALTLNRTLPSIQNKEAGHVVHALFTDGVLFYRAPQGLKSITGQLEFILMISCFILSSATFVYEVAMKSRITLSLKKEGTRGSVPLDIHLRSKFLRCCDYQRPIMKPHPPTPSSRASPVMQELSTMMYPEGQRDSEVCTCFTCPAVTGAFDPADDERSRYREAMV